MKYITAFILSFFFWCSATDLVSAAEPAHEFGSLDREMEVIDPYVQPIAEPTYMTNEQLALLLAALGETSSSVSGTLNSTILNLMDRMVDGYPSYYKYAGFRTSEDDSYSSKLYISRSATVESNTVTFGDDCIAVSFERYTVSGYSSYTYYTVTETPNASVDVTTRSIVYTNTLDGYPTLGTRPTFSDEQFWILIFVLLATTIIVRRNAHD